MQKPELFDVVELLIDLPNQDLQAGARGAIVDVYDDAYEVEFANEMGETIVLVPLTVRQFVVVWRSASKSWVSVVEKFEALMVTLPEEMLVEVFDFARNTYSGRSRSMP